MFYNIFSERKGKKVVHLGGAGRGCSNFFLEVELQYLLLYPSILLGYPRNIHTFMPSICSWCVIINFSIIIIYHDFLPRPRRGSHVKSDKTHTDTQSSRYTHPLAHILDSWALIFSSCALLTVYPNHIM